MPDAISTVSPWLARPLKSMRRQLQSAIDCFKTRPDEQLNPWLRPGIWFWIAVLVGMAVRAYFVVFTEGTYDLVLWQTHAAGIQKEGLIEYYHANIKMNHPPFISIVLSWLLGFTQKTALPFRILLRAPFALLDATTAMLLLCTLRHSRYRFVATVCYWLHPLTMIFSAYHGNTDSSMAFFLMLCFYLISKQKLLWAAAALGISAWVKLPALLAIPAFVFYLQNWRTRFKFILLTAIIAISTYLPALLADPAVIYRNVFAYPGQLIHTTSGIPVWGTRVFGAHLDNSPLQWQLLLNQPISFYLKYNKWFCIVPILLLAWLRRYKRTTRELGATIAATYTIMYGFSNFWSFQYFAWSIPFWFFTGMYFVVPATLLASAYIYSLYWLVCGNPWLLGKWDFPGHPYWPDFLKSLRNLALLLFFISAWCFLIAGLCAEIRRRYNRTRSLQPDNS